MEDDRDFISLASSCSTLSRSLIPPESAVWKKRFLSLYDYPLVERQEEYAFAYQARRFVLSQFVAFTKPDDERLKIQMIVLKDMVVGKHHQFRLTRGLLFGLSGCLLDHLLFTS